MTAVLCAEVRRSAHLPLVLTTAAIVALVLFIQAHITGVGPNALVAAHDASQGAVAFAETAELVLALAAAVPILVLSADIVDDSRGLLFTYPIPTLRLAGSRLVAAFAWCLVWSLLVLLLGNWWVGSDLPLWRDIALLLPEQVFVLGGIFAVAEWTRETGLGAGFALLALVLGFGIQGLPFAHPVSMHLELVDLRNHPLSGAVWLNRLALLGLTMGFMALGTIGMRLHRRRGSYAGS